jgi:hypothetical protein
VYCTVLTQYRLASHPLTQFEHAEARLLASLMKVDGKTRITANPIGGGDGGGAVMLRVDIVKVLYTIAIPYTLYTVLMTTFL